MFLSSVAQSNPCRDIFEAVEKGDVECVREFLKRGVDPNIRDIYVRGRPATPFNIGLYLKRDKLKEGDRYTEVGGYCCDGVTPLHVAARKGYVEIAKLLLEHGADPNIKDLHGWTPLHDAAYWGNVEVARLLLQHGADPNVKGKRGETPLILAISGDSQAHADVAKLLLEHGADPNVRDKLGNNSTALHRAIVGRRKDMVRLLLEKGADPNAKDDYGDTPLHTAVVIGDPEIVELLLRYGADVNAKDNDGTTPLDRVPHIVTLSDYVSYTDFKTAAEIAKILLKHGAKAGDRRTPKMINMLLKYFGDEKTAADNPEIINMLLKYFSNKKTAADNKPRRKTHRKKRDGTPHQLNHSFFSISFFCSSVWRSA
jgi:ankyrin repeat protein